MKLIARFILLLFIVFLTTPTVVTLIKKNTDVSVFYSYSEEEENLKTLKEFKADLNHGFDYPVLAVTSLVIPEIVSENSIHHDNIAGEISLPPPELI